MRVIIRVALVNSAIVLLIRSIMRSQTNLAAIARVILIRRGIETICWHQVSLIPLIRESLMGLFKEMCMISLVRVLELLMSFN